MTFRFGNSFSLDVTYAFVPLPLINGHVAHETRVDSPFS